MFELYALEAHSKPAEKSRSKPTWRGIATTAVKRCPLRRALNAGVFTLAPS